MTAIINPNGSQRLISAEDVQEISLKTEQWMKLCRYATGQHLNSGNPYLEDALGRGADDIQARIADMAAASGRSLSSSHQNLLSEDLGNYYTDARLQNYQNEVSNMMGANQLMGSNIAQQGNILNSQVGAQQAGDALALQAGQALPTLYQAGLLPAETLAQVGAGKEEQQRLILQDEIDKYYANRDIPKQQAEWLNGIAGGAGQFSNSSSTVQSPSTPWWQQAAGIGMMGAGLFA